MSWKIYQLSKTELSNPVLIEGLPGIGNVGKIAVDFLVEELGAKPIFRMRSYSLPHSVFINEQNLVELPNIEIFYKKTKRQHFLFLCGDVQPSDEISSYEFSEEIIKICRQQGCSDIITLGGIGLVEIPKKPRIFCTGNSKKAVDKYKEKGLQTKLYGVVGPIMGVTGLLLGMSPPEINAIALLAETYGHPMYLGVKGAKEILKYLNKRFGLGISIEKLDQEIKDMEDEMVKRTEELAKVYKDIANHKISKLGKEINYIG